MQTAATPVLETHGLSYSFRSGQPVLNNIHLQVPAGSIYGFLGPNGAGKTTTMRLLTGLLPQQGDQVRFFNQSLQAQLPQLFHRVGALIETPSLYLHLSGLDNLRVVARFRNLPEKIAQPALQWVRLADAANKRVRHYSLGMKQRLAIAMALLSEPELLLLDEPVNGLDPAGMLEIRELLMELNRQRGVTIFVSSHLLHEVEKMCTHIGIIHKGSMRFEGTLQQLEASAVSARTLLISISDAQQWIGWVQQQHPHARIVQNDTISLTIQEKEDALQLNRFLVTAGAPVWELKLQGGLENWFMEITNDSMTYKS